VSSKSDLFGDSQMLEETVLLQSQPRNVAARGLLCLGPSQDSHSRRSVGLCSLRSTAQRRWRALGMGRKISKKQSLTAEDTRIMCDNTR